MAVMKNRRVQNTTATRAAAASVGEGVEVVVLVKSTYNGPNNKTIGLQEVGATIRVAANGYADSLIADGFVCRPDDPRLVDERDFADIVEKMPNADIEPIAAPVVEDVAVEAAVDSDEADAETESEDVVVDDDAGEVPHVTRTHKRPVKRHAN
mgnify:CR=1 FL=1